MTTYCCGTDWAHAGLAKMESAATRRNTKLHRVLDMYVPPLNTDSMSHHGPDREECGRLEYQCQEHSSIRIPHIARFPRWQRLPNRPSHLYRPVTQAASRTTDVGSQSRRCLPACSIW